MFVSERWLSDHNVAKTDLRGVSHYELFPDLPEHWKGVHQRCLRGAVERNAEEKFVLADGTVHWIQWEVRPWHDDLGLIGGIVIYSEDISSRINARIALETLNKTLESRVQERTDELARSEQRYRSMFESAYDSVLVADSSGTMLIVNERLTQTFGYAAEELVGQSVEILLPESSRRAHTLLRDQYARDPLTRPMGVGSNLYGRAKTGREFPVEVALNPIPAPDGFQIHAVIRDVTETKKFEERERFLSELGKKLSEILGYQERLQMAADFTVPGIADMCVISMLHGDDLNFSAVAMADPSKRQLVQSYEKHVRATQGNSRYTANYAVLTGNPLLIEDVQSELLSKHDLDTEQRARIELVGATSFVTCPLIPREIVVGTMTFVMTDSGRKFQAGDLEYLGLIANRCAVGLENAKLYHEAQMAIKTRELVLSIVAHELLNPIGVINMAGQMLKMEQLTGAARNDVLAERILRSTTMMQRLISDLLDFGTIQAGTLKIERSRVPVSIVMASALEAMSLRAKEKRQGLHVDISDQVPDIMCDQGRIVQVLWNLVGNAIKFSPEEETISISVVPDGKGVRFAVKDSGPGLEEHELAKVFDRFWQSGKSRKLSAGLGLAISKGLVEAHGGKIWVESRRNHGCSFHFWIPSDSPG